METDEERSLRDRGAVVWLVEDEALLAMAASAALDDAGYSVREFGSAEEALARLKVGERPDLLITDYSLPGMTGQQLARAARDDHAVSAILMATGHADDGSSDFPVLAKPYSDSDLLQRVAALLTARA